jgi:hypothetical protein
MSHSPQMGLSVKASEFCPFSWSRDEKAMLAAFESLWQFWVIAVSSIFFLVDPFAAIPTFLAIAGDETAQRQRYLARRASTACFIVLSVFAAVGPFIFRMFGLTRALR